jgi:CDP-glycerol glycerophosphotransferase
VLHDIDQLQPHARLYIYGSGSAGRSLLMWLEKCRPDVSVLGFIDSFSSGRCAGKKKVSLDRFAKQIKPGSYHRILIASGANRAIVRKLDDLGITNYSIVSLPSYLMANLLPTPLAERLKAAKINLLAPFFKRRLHLFFGEHGGKFIGNNKYYYLYLQKKLPFPVYWVVEDAALAEELAAKGIHVLHFKAKARQNELFKAAYFYFDNMTWQRQYPWLRYFKAKIIHMSHGVGLKVTEKMLIPREFTAALTPKERKRLDGKIFKNDLLVSTSDFYARSVSAPAYNTPLERIALSGYPRNDVFYREIPGSAIFTDQEILAAVEGFKTTGHRIIVYAPTFRDMDSRFKYAEVIDYPVFNRYLASHRLVMVIKGHTSVAGKSETQNRESLSHILFYRSDRDGYPLLKKADLLITDYSSIYMDFLHCRKPVIFFVYDYHEYIANHREIQFDYETMTPGPQARDYEELTRWLSHFLVQGQDGFATRREEILDLGFLYKDGLSSRRLHEQIVASSGQEP